MGLDWGIFVMADSVILNYSCGLSRPTQSLNGGYFGT